MTAKTALSPLALVGLLVAGPAHAQLTYVESSQGLDVPGFESGDSELEMADVNGDGHVDIISVGDHGNPNINSDQEGILVWLNDGRGSWTHVHFGDLGYGGVAVGDVDGDGTADVAYGIHHDYSSTDLGDQLLEVALGDGTGAFWTPWDDGLAANGEDWGLFSTDLADVDGDGDLDVGSMGFGASAGLQVYLNQGDGTWKRSWGFVEGNSAHVFAFGDVDGDGQPDIATAKQEGTVWLNDGEGFFTVADGNLPPTSSFGWRDGPSLGDVDEDGHDDLAYCNGDDHVEVWLWRGADTWEDVSVGLPDTGTCQHTALHDMDGDGHVDVVTFGRGTVHVFAGDGVGETWTSIAHFSTGNDPGHSSAFRVGGDVDHNGYADMAILDENQGGGWWDPTYNLLSCHREATPASALGVRVVEPGPRRTLLAGQVAFLEWAASVPAGETAVATLELSTAGPGGPWETIVVDRPNDGRHQWVVPPRYTEAAYLRVTVRTGSGESSATSAAPFGIARRPDPIAVTVDYRTSVVSWSDALGREHYHLYRGSLDELRATGAITQDPGLPDADRFCDLAATSLDDEFEPAPGRGVYYVVTAYRTMDDRIDPEARMAESTLGQDSAARMRRNVNPCPEP